MHDPVIIIVPGERSAVPSSVIPNGEHGVASYGPGWQGWWRISPEWMAGLADVDVVRSLFPYAQGWYEVRR